MRGPDHEVAIIGAGPVGMLLACLLAQDGRDVVVFEQRPSSSERGRAIGVHPPGLAALAAAGIAERLRKQALCLDGGEVLSEGRILARMDFPPEHPVHTLPQQRVDALLSARFEEFAEGVQRGRRVRAVTPDGGQMRLAVDAQEVTASLVIAADGVRSERRGDAGIAWRRRPGRADYVMVDVDDPGTDAQARLFLEPSGLVESFPLPDGRRRWVLFQSPEEPIRSVADLRRMIAARTGEAPVIPDDTELSEFRAQQHCAARFVHGRMILLGDAAHETSPIGGQGMNLGWVHAQRLAAAIRQVGALGGKQLPPLLDLWEGRALRAARRAQRRSAFYMAMGRPANALTLPFRDLLVHTLGSDALREHTAAAITMRRV